MLFPVFKFPIKKILSLVGFEVEFGKKEIQNYIAVGKNIWGSYFLSDPQCNYTMKTLSFQKMNGWIIFTYLPF